MAAWDLGSELLGRDGCADSPDGVHCAASMALAPEEPVTLSRTLTVPAAMDVGPTVWVRARQGPRLADLMAAPGSTRATGDADLIDVAGSAYAAADGDPRTSWTAPQSVVQHRSAPTLTVTLPRPAEVTALRSRRAHHRCRPIPPWSPIDLGDGPQVRDAGQRGPGRRPSRCDPGSPTPCGISLLDWDDVIDRTALGFDQLKPPGLAEVTALGAGGAPIARGRRGGQRSRPVDLSCGQGPVIAVSGRFVQTSVSTTVAALLDGDPDSGPPVRSDARSPCGRVTQELLISPGAAFIADGVQLSGPLADRLATAATTPADIATWSARPPRDFAVTLADRPRAGGARERQPGLGRHAPPTAPL